jgi:hypothetical protein
MTNFILDVYGSNQGVGFDIGCSYEATVQASNLLSSKAAQLCLQILVNTFMDGYATTCVN